MNYWAGARAAAGLVSELFEGETIAAALIQARQAHRDSRFDAVLAASSLMSDGRVLRAEDLEAPLTDAIELEVLPPFAGGSLC